MSHEHRAAPSRALPCITLLAAITLWGCAARETSHTFAGDWDAYVAAGSAARPGFEGWRRMGFAHFAGSDSGFAGSIRRRTGELMLAVTRVAPEADSVLLSGVDDQSLKGTWSGDSFAGVLLAAGKPAGRRIRLVRRAAPFVVEKQYELWPGAVSDSQYAVTEDTAVFMTTRDGARLVSYIARPVGNGPFGVVLQRTPYTRILHPAGRYWASRGYIFVAQHVRGRDISDGKDFGDYDTDVRDGYDAVEWAAKLPGANGRVGLIGHSDEGRLSWYAAVSAPPHLAAIAPSAASGDPWRIVPYEDMVFSPINVAWACLMRARTLQNINDLDIGSALTHLPLSDLPQRLGCGDVPLWDRWIAHPTLDAYWRAHAVTTNIAKVRAPVLQISGWYDDSRGPIDYTNALNKVPGHPFIRLVMGPGAHKGVDYVAGDFGPQSRVETRRLQLRWFDHYLLGKNNGVDTEPPVDIFVFGDNTWRKEPAWPLARAVPAQWFLSSSGNANTSKGDGVLDTIPPAGAPADTFTYDPANPTPYLIDSRELETSLNEDFTSLNETRRDELVFTSRALTKPIEVTGPMAATLWAASDAKDTDWNIMLLDVFPDGHAERVQDGVARARFRHGYDKEVPLAPGSVERYDIDLWFTSRVFTPGHRLRVTVSSALFPKYDRNLNTGGNNERDSTFVVAHQRLIHDVTHPSHVTLPIIPR
ncbi:MAG TPA: CocE/NonD family hydrolase, partial [Gemmatimonadaceae bacterium]|nr:CocE/NonD family hydrolase [Gemmatimonadaceae bacterium]